MRLGVFRCRPSGASEGLKTGLEGLEPAASDDAAGLGEVPEHYPQAPGTRPRSATYERTPLLRGICANYLINTLLGQALFPDSLLLAKGERYRPAA